MTGRLYDKPMQPHDILAAWRSRARAAAHGLLAVLCLLVSSVDALITARVGIPRLAYLARRVRQELASEYRRGRAGAVDITVREERP